MRRRGALQLICSHKPLKSFGVNYHPREVCNQDDSDDDKYRVNCEGGIGRKIHKPPYTSIYYIKLSANFIKERRTGK